MSAAVHSVYKADFADGKSYVGRTSDAARRFAEHRKSGAVRCRVLVIGSYEYCCEMEKRAITAYGTLVPRGMNRAVGGGNSPHTDETRRKLSLAQRVRHEEGRNSLTRPGWCHSDETKAKMRASQRLRWSLTSPAARRAHTRAASESRRVPKSEG